MHVIRTLSGLDVIGKTELVRALPWQEIQWCMHMDSIHCMYVARPSDLTAVPCNPYADDLQGTRDFDPAKSLSDNERSSATMHDDLACYLRLVLPEQGINGERRPR